MNQHWNYLGLLHFTSGAIIEEPIVLKYSLMNYPAIFRVSASGVFEVFALLGFCAA